MIIILIILLAVGLRMLVLDQSLWLDEAISALAARDFSYGGIIFDFLKINNHPPLFYLLLKFWGETFGFTDWVLRIPSVILGTLTIYLVYKIAGLITEKKSTALLSSLFLACSPILVYYSQEVRMYILITFLALLQIYFFLNILKKPKIRDWVLFSITGCLLFFSDYITLFLFPVFILYPVLKKDSKTLVNVLLSFIPLGILLGFWYPELSSQIAKNKEIISLFPGWQYIIGGPTFKNLVVLWMKFTSGRISFEPKLIYYLFVFTCSLPVIISLYLALQRFRKDLLIWLWLIIPVLLGFIFSFILPVFNYFRFIYVVPALLILNVLGIYQLKDLKLQYLLIGSIILTNLLSLGIYYSDPGQQRENWRQAVDFIEKNGTEEDIVVFEFHEPFAPYRWYSKGKIDSIGATDSYFAQKSKTDQKLETALQGKTGVYYFEYLRDLSDPNRVVEQKLESDGFYKGEVYNDFHNIGQVTYLSRSYK